MPYKRGLYPQNGFNQLWYVEPRVNTDTGQIKNCSVGHCSIYGHTCQGKGSTERHVSLWTRIGCISVPCATCKYRHVADEHLYTTPRYIMDRSQINIGKVWNVDKWKIPKRFHVSICTGGRWKFVPCAPCEWRQMKIEYSDQAHTSIGTREKWNFMKCASWK